MEFDNQCRTATLCCKSHEKKKRAVPCCRCLTSKAVTEPLKLRVKQTSQFFCRISKLIFLTMKTIGTLSLVLFPALVVAGSKFEAMDGQNVTISFDIDEVEKADEVRITFKEDKKEYAELIAQKPWVYDDPPRPGVTLIVGKGCLSVIIQNVNISRSGLYKAEAYTREKVSEVTATLVVNKAPVSSSPAPPHSSSSPTPLSSSDLHWLYALIPLVIVVSGGVYFWKLRRAVRNSQHQMMKEPEKLLLSPDPVSQQKELEKMIV